MAQVKIGSNFFAKAKADYNDWRWAIAREFVQNCVDARGTSTVSVTVEVQNDDVLLVVENDGEAMTEDILVNKLLALGESGKDFVGTVGGMGKAKELLYMSNVSYRIHSGDHLIVGCGGDYDLTQVALFHGTRSEVVLRDSKLSAKELADILVNKFRSIIIMTQRPNILFRVNCQMIPAILKKGSRRRGFNWGTVYTNKTFENRLIVRIGGMPMFTKYIDMPKTVVVELEGSSGDYLTSNRDGLLWKYQDQLDEFMRELAINKRSALEEKTTSYVHYRGNKLEACGEEVAKINIQEVLTAAYATVQTAEDVVNEDEEGPTLATDSRPVMETFGPDSAYEERKENKRLPQIGFDFVIRNELGMAIPAYLIPETFGEYSRKLIRNWAACMLELHRLFGDTSNFSVGFVLSETVEAMHEKSNTYGTVMFINPTVVKRSSVGSRSLGLRWKFTPAGKMAILAAAVHEYCHRTYRYHDEDFSSLLTRCSGVVFHNIKRFHKCFR